MAALQQKSRLPFIGKVVKYIPNHELVMRRTLDVDEDLFLSDHLFVNASGVKPPSACLPVVPFTVSLEMMAEVAACHAPGYGLLAFEQIAAQEWIQLDDARLNLDIVATVQPSVTPETIVVFVKVFKGGHSKPAIKGRVVFGQNYQVNLNLSFSEFQNPYDSHLLPQQIYQEGFLFHGPLFQVVGSQPRFGTTGVTGDLLVRDKTNMFRSNSDPEMLTDPLLMDGVGQFIGLWAMERDWFVFPIGVEKIEFYRPTPSVGTLTPLRGEITQSNVRFLTSNVEVQDGGGGVWFRVQGWKKWIFHWEKKMVNFRRQPTQYCASEKVVLGEVQENCSVHFVRKSDFVDLDVHIIARNYLSQKEMEQFQTLQNQSVGYESWLREIIAVKDAAREWVAVTMGSSELLHPASFEVTKKDSSYYVEGLLVNEIPLPAIEVVSTESEAMACVSRESSSLVVHKVDSTSHDNPLLILTRHEQSLLEHVPHEEKTNYAQRILCAKKALTKNQLSLGLRSSQTFEITHIGSRGEMECCSESDEVTYRINTHHQGDFVIAALRGAGYQSERENLQQPITETVNGTL